MSVVLRKTNILYFFLPYVIYQWGLGGDSELVHRGSKDVYKTEPTNAPDEARTLNSHKGGLGVTIGLQARW